MRTSAVVQAWVLIAALLHGGTATAAQVILEASKDNTLFESNTGALSNGIGEYLFSGMNNGHQLRRAVLAFDIAASVPAGATITSVTLQLNVSMQLAGTHASTLHRLTSDWGEGNSNSTLRGGGQGAAAATNDATWLHTFFDTANWTTPGGDFVAQASATVDIGGSGPVTWASTASLVADVQGWLDAPESNFGWIILTDELTTPSAKRFDSRENSTAANRPSLVVVYEGTSVDAVDWSALKALFR